MMGGEQAAKVMTILGEDGARRAGREPDMAALGAAAKQIVDTYDTQSTALFATARLWDDGIIDPRDTRRVVGMCLDVCKEAESRQLRPNSFGVARM
jgi:geranyl-CoA carboxylase beta subunit